MRAVPQSFILLTKEREHIRLKPKPISEEACVTQKRVVVLEGEQIFGAAVSSLLSARHHLEVRALRFSDRDFLAAVREFKPEVIIIDEGALMVNLSITIRMLKQHPNAKMIVLNPATNSLKVFERQMVAVRALDDFLDLV